MSRVDFAKLATYIEPVPPLSPPLVQHLLAAFRSHERRVYDDLDPTLYSPGYDLDSLANPLLVHSQYTTLGSCLAHVLAVPRNLKGALRRTRDTWRKLHGEVNFDELLVVNALRFSDRLVEIRPNTAGQETSPSGPFSISDRVKRISIFDLLLRNADWIRAGHRENIRDRKSNTLEQQILAEIMRSDSDPEGRLIGFVFGRVNHHYHDDSRPQSAGNPWSDIYWNRILSEEITDTVTDQSVLKAMRDWQQAVATSTRLSSADRVVDWLMNDGPEAGKIIQFRNQWNEQAVTAAMTSVVHRTIREYKALARGVHDHCSSLINLARLAHRQRLSPEVRWNLVRDGVVRSMALRLSLVFQIEYWLMQRPSATLNDVGDGDMIRMEIRDFVRQQFIKEFSSDSGAFKLVQALHGDHVVALSWIVRRRWDEGLPPVAAEDWSPVAPVLVESARMDPLYSGKALAFLLGESENVLSRSSEEGLSSGWKAQMDLPYSKALLGPYFADAMRAMVSITPDGQSDEVAAAIKAVIQYAAAYVAAYPNHERGSPGRDG